MPELSTTDRQRIWRGFMRLLSQHNEVIALSDPDLRAAVDATDTWIENNQASYNSALPAAAQSNLTTNQKTFLFCTVALAKVSISTLRQILGEVD